MAGPAPRPWGKGTAVPTFGLGAGGFFSDIANVSFGLGFSYYLINGLSAGLSFSDTILIYRSTLKAQYPGIERELPTNIFDITPSLQYVFFRSRRFSPYVFGGVGPGFFNHGAGTHGQWVAGPGVLLNVGGPLYVNISVGCSSMFPDERCNEALTYDPGMDGSGSILLDVCSFQWGPQIGAVLAFGGGRRARQRRREEQRRRSEPEPYQPPPPNPMPDVVEPEPVEPSSPSGAAPGETAAPAPTDVALPPGRGAADGTAPPSEGTTDVAPSGGTDMAPPPSDGTTDVAPPPSDGTTDVAPAPSGEATEPRAPSETTAAPPPSGQELSRVRSVPRTHLLRTSAE